MDSADLALSFGPALLTVPDDRAAKEMVEHLLDHADDVMARAEKF